MKNALCARLIGTRRHTKFFSLINYLEINCIAISYMASTVANRIIIQHGQAWVCIGRGKYAHTGRR